MDDLASAQSLPQHPFIAALKGEIDRPSNLEFAALQPTYTCLSPNVRHILRLTESSYSSLKPLNALDQGSGRLLWEKLTRQQMSALAIAPPSHFTVQSEVEWFVASISIQLLAEECHQFVSSHAEHDLRALFPRSAALPCFEVRTGLFPLFPP